MVSGHQVKGLPLETGPQVNVKEGQLRTNPLAEGKAGFGTRLHSGLQHVLHASVLCDLFNQLHHGFI